MTTLYHTTSLHRQQNKTASNTLGVRLLSSKNRNLSISKLNQKIINIQNVRQTIDHLKNTESSNFLNQNKELKKYCLNRLRINGQSQKFILLRKNRSLKVIKKEDSVKYFNRTKVESQASQEVLNNHVKQPKSLLESSEKIKGVSIKRRVELIKKNSNKLKIFHKEASKMQGKKSETSFQHKYVSTISEFQKFMQTNKIQSENLLCQGLKKSSSSKMKALVKNPFDRLMKIDQLKLSKNKPTIQLLSAQFQTLQESSIVQNLDSSITSISNRCEIQQMLALI